MKIQTQYEQSKPRIVRVLSFISSDHRLRSESYSLVLTEN
uniref:Uncharacterized protein n=1 Tax=Arundo donax TaxID=35708 RepID=A0A0A9MGQ3_ARUDO